MLVQPTEMAQNSWYAQIGPPFTSGSVELGTVHLIIIFTVSIVQPQDVNNLHINMILVWGKNAY